MGSKSKWAYLAPFLLFEFILLVGSTEGRSRHHHHHHRHQNNDYDNEQASRGDREDDGAAPYYPPKPKVEGEAPEGGDTTPTPEGETPVGEHHAGIQGRGFMGSLGLRALSAAWTGAKALGSAATYIPGVTSAVDYAKESAKPYVEMARDQAIDYAMNIALSGGDEPTTTAAPAKRK